MKGTHYYSVTAAVQERERKILIAARVMKWTESNKSNVSDQKRQVLKEVVYSLFTSACPLVHFAYDRDTA